MDRSITVVLFVSVLMGIIHGAGAQTAAELNLGFEQAGELPSKPMLWITSGDGFAANAQGCQVGLDESESKSGKRSPKMKSGGRSSGFGNAFLSLPGSVAAGKHIKVSCWIKTKDVAAQGYAGIWCRIDGRGGGMLAHDDLVERVDATGKVTTDDRGVRGTTDWKLCAIEHDVPSTAHAIVFGALLVGEGMAWWDDFSVEVDRKPYEGKALAELAAERAPKPAELAWLRKNAIAFKTERAGSGLDDLQPLKTIVGDAHIVALGEGTHGTAEFFRMKHRLVEFLASEMGFTCFAIEANMPEAYRVNDYVLHGKGDPKALLKGMYFWTWDTQEVLDMILWMRKFNESGKGRIQFLGFDMQTSAVAAENVRKFVAEVDPEFAQTAADAYDGLQAAIQAAGQRLFASAGTGAGGGANAAAVDAANAARKKRVQAVLKHLEDSRERYLKKKPAAEVDWAIQNARVADQAAGPLVATGAEGYSHRDRCMADNVDWILSQAPAGTRIVLWAHNGHVSRIGMGATSMGSHLARRHGSDYRVLGFAAHEGRYTAVLRGTGLGTHPLHASLPGSIEYYGHCSGLSRMIIDLHRASKDDQASAWLTKGLQHRSIGALAQDASYSAVLTDEYDALIFFDNTSASACFRLPPPAQVKKQPDARPR
jgi:erythromycin esterase